MHSKASQLIKASCDLVLADWDRQRCFTSTLLQFSDMKGIWQRSYVLICFSDWIARQRTDLSHMFREPRMDRHPSRMVTGK
jgi:hypothetical protein